MSAWSWLNLVGLIAAEVAAPRRDGDRQYVALHNGLSRRLLHRNKWPQTLSAALSSESYQLLKQNRHVPRGDPRLPLRLSDQSVGAQSRQIGTGALTPP
jgi:hypothetical protein